MLCIIDFQALNEGLTIALVGYGVVFSALILLYFVIKNLIRLLNVNPAELKAQADKLRKHKEEKCVKQEEEKVEDVSEVYAAITAALHMYYYELHDEENYVLTLKRVTRDYSPWSSKIYGLRKSPRNIN